MRARNLKPSIFTHELLATSDPLYTWVFEGLWCLADRDGRLEDKPRNIHLKINPGRAYEGTEASLAWLAQNGFILRYSVAGASYIQVLAFGKHQNPHHKEPPSKIPPPQDGASPVNAQVKPGACPGKPSINVDTETQGLPQAGPSTDSVQPHSDRADSGFRIPDSGFRIPNNATPENPGHDRGQGDQSPPPNLFPILSAEVRQAAAEAFLRIQAAYPPYPRPKWIQVEVHCCNLVNRGEATWPELEAGTARYAKFIAETGSYVTAPVNFFSAADEPWRLPWDPPKSKAQRRQDDNISESQKWLDEQEARDAQQ